MFPEYVYVAVTDEYESYAIAVYSTFEGATHHEFKGEEVQEHEHKFRKVIGHPIYICTFVDPYCSAAIEMHKLLP